MAVLLGSAVLSSAAAVPKVCFPYLRRYTRACELMKRSVMRLTRIRKASVCGAAVLALEAPGGTRMSSVLALSETTT